MSSNLGGQGLLRAFLAFLGISMHIQPASPESGDWNVPEIHVALLSQVADQLVAVVSIASSEPELSHLRWEQQM